jgi:hypothetical protein
MLCCLFNFQFSISILEHLYKCIALRKIGAYDTTPWVYVLCAECRHTPIVEHHGVCSRKEDTMSIWWMPRRCVPMKDVA